MSDLRRCLGILWVVGAVGVLPLVAACRFHGGGRVRTDSLKALETEPWGQPDAVVAEVNGRPITRGEFYVRVLRRFGTERLLHGVIKEELFLQEAERLDIRVSSEQRDARVERIFSRMKHEAGGLQQLEEQYRREGLSLATVRRDIAREVATQLLIGEVTKAMRNIDDEVIREYYKNTYRHKRYMTRQIAYAFYTEPGEPPETEQRRKMEARSKALRAVDHLRKGEDFEAMAEIKISQVSEQLRISDDNRPVTKTVITYMIGQDGPFTREYDQATFNAFNARQDIDAHAAELAKLREG